ncbi:hypothetical protein T310_5780 [Rasamsonia emersonii CBS 393.64]|uniref:Uncharacterized protein n=1 Tax=Rasamsonia emersonii (strain ATCC 16479 / CBS 393.64 / IMI 116815) TaxID=1408163 RepID=A0A0F4YQV0_RASE3|nr:hypothetical protein T310_5780 [Rasamsonia emersonii CBS 393.64]KKA20211.1 hypothetical protein T310_5780 [Rasamsonia emersonii CBS 393.64]
MRAGFPIRARDKGRRLVEQLVHVLQIQPLGLRKESPEEERVGQIAHDEDDVVPPSDRRHCDGRDLADHRVEGERRHGAPGHALNAHRGAEQLCRDRPRQRTAGDEEDEVEHPRHDDKPPVRARVGRRRREDLDERAVHCECHAHDDPAVDLHQPASDRVDDHDADCCPEERDDRVDCGQQQSRARRDPDLGEDLRREVLDGADAGHLAAGLDHHDEDRAAEVGPVAKEIEIGFLLLMVFFSDLGLDEVVFRDDVGIMDVAVRVELRQVRQPFFPPVVVAQPSRALGEDVHKSTQDDGWDDLDGKGDTPFSTIPGTVPGHIASVACPGCKYLAKCVEELLQASNLATDASMANFSLMYCEQANANTGNQSSKVQHGDDYPCCLDDAATDENAAGHQNRPTTPQAVGESGAESAHKAATSEESDYRPRPRIGIGLQEECLERPGGDHFCDYAQIIAEEE